MNEDGGSIFVFNLGGWFFWTHTSVLMEMLKDLIKSADQFVHKPSRLCNSGWPCPAVSALHLGTDCLGSYHTSIFSIRYLYFPGQCWNYGQLFSEFPLCYWTLKGKKSRHLLIRDSNGTHKAAWVWFLWTCLTVQPYQYHCLITWMVAKVF